MNSFSSSSSSSTGAAAAPKALHCDICGGRFFPRSLPIHREQCIRKNVEKLKAGQLGEREAEAFQRKMQMEGKNTGGYSMVGKINSNSNNFRENSSKWDDDTGMGNNDYYDSFAQNSGSFGAGGRNNSSSQQGNRGGSNGFNNGRGASGGGSRGGFAQNQSMSFGESQSMTMGSMGGGGGGSFDDDAAGLIPCSHCGRSFAPDRIDKHESICIKVGKKKPRKVFDITKKRVATDGNGETLGGPPVFGAAAKKRQQQLAMQQKREREKQPPKLNRNWKAESEAFRAAIREARSLPPMPQWGSGGGGGTGRGGSSGYGQQPSSRNAGGSKSRRGVGGGLVMPGSGRGGGGGLSGGGPAAPSAKATPSPGTSNFVPCKVCSRTFAPDRIDKHTEICTKQQKERQLRSGPPKAGASRQAAAAQQPVTATNRHLQQQQQFGGSSSSRYDPSRTTNAGMGRGNDIDYDAYDAYDRYTDTNAQRSQQRQPASRTVGGANANGDPHASANKANWKFDPMTGERIMPGGGGGGASQRINGQSFGNSHSRGDSLDRELAMMDRGAYGGGQNPNGISSRENAGPGSKNRFNTRPGSGGVGGSGGFGGGDMSYGGGGHHQNTVGTHSRKGAGKGSSAGMSGGPQQQNRDPYNRGMTNSSGGTRNTGTRPGSGRRAEPMPTRELPEWGGGGGGSEKRHPLLSSGNSSRLKQPGSSSNAFGGPAPKPGATGWGREMASMGSGSGGMSLSNATSRDNPLASNAYQMAEHAKPSGRR